MSYAFGFSVIKERNVLPFVLIALMPFVWYALTLNHSGVHPFIAFHELSITVFATAILLFCTLEKKVKPISVKTVRTGNGKKKETAGIGNRKTEGNKGKKKR